MIRDGSLSDVDQLVQIEKECFDSDRLSRRSFRHFLTKGRARLLVVEDGEIIIGYVLLLFHLGTSLARLYSIAVHQERRKSGVAKCLIQAAEAAALELGCVTLRLEVRVDNQPSISLFESLGYYCFGRYLKYYEDDVDALRLEKRLLTTIPASLGNVPYYRQTLDFTCGPASLMMAMKALNNDVELNRTLELRVWRESTSIYMTSGHGGCGPYGLALAAHQRGFEVVVYVKDKDAFFIDSVRSEEKKEVIRLVEKDFISELNREAITLHYQPITTQEIVAALDVLVQCPWC